MAEIYRLQRSVLHDASLSSGMWQSVPW